MKSTLMGYQRSSGSWGARNHVLVLPSVVCASVAAEQVAAATGAIPLLHQHGCGHIGDDVSFTERAFTGMAVHPNVAGAVVISLGCETIQGRRLATRIGELGQRIEFAGIQLSGGTKIAVDIASAEAAGLATDASRLARQPMPTSKLVIGVECDTAIGLEIVQALGVLARATGAAVVAAVDPKLALTHDMEKASRLSFGDPAVAGTVQLLEDPGAGSERHVALAVSGAQLIISFRKTGRSPVGFAICPVIAVATDPDDYEALRDDFDMLASGDAQATALAIWVRTLAIFNGDDSASEQRGARDFALRRFARNM